MTPTRDEQLAAKRLDDHERRLDDHDQVLNDISEHLGGLLDRIDAAKRYALLIGVALVSGSKGGSSVVDMILKGLGG